MSQSTQLIGPYDKIQTFDKVRIMGGIPQDIAKELFTETFTLRGVQDKVIARLFHIFYQELKSKHIQSQLAECITIYDREKVLNHVLNTLAELQFDHEKQTNKDYDFTSPA